MTQFQEETGHLYNLEATPAEGTTYRFAKEDKKRWPAILQAGTAEQPYYTNSSQLPVGFTDDPFEALAAPGGAAIQIHRRHRAAPVHGRAPVQRRRLPRSGAGAHSRAFACPTSPSRPRSPSAPRTATWRANTRSARAATKSGWPPSGLHWLRERRLWRGQCRPILKKKACSPYVISANSYLK
jgi:hypothetical protein